MYEAAYAYTTKYFSGAVFICNFKDGYCVDEPVQIAVVSSSPWGTRVLRMKACGDVDCAASVYDNIGWIKSVLSEIICKMFL